MSDLLLRYTPALVLVLSLIALLTQIRTVRRQLFIQNFLAQSKEYRLLVEKFPSGILSEDYDLSQESPEDRARALRVFYSYFDICFDKFYLRRRRLIPKQLWKNWERGMALAMRLPAFRQGWEAFSAVTSHDREFVVFVDRLINEATSSQVAQPARSRGNP